MATTRYVRQDIWALQSALGTWEPVTLAYAQAVATLQDRPASNPTSWAYLAAMHGSYAPAPPGATWNQCQHGSWHFLPWHRMYIYWFERIVRAAVIENDGPSDWALPYWNYSKGFPSNTLPPAFREPALPDGSRNPLYIEQRNAEPAPGINGGAQLPPRSVSHSYAFQFENFTDDGEPFGFGGGESVPIQFDGGIGQLENQPHNVIHDLIGGEGPGRCQGSWMSNPMCAAQDPIFWVHHSNIDRLWGLWLAQGGRRANPVDTAWLTQQFEFRDENGRPVVMKTSEVLDTLVQLGYTYDDQPPTVARRFVAAAMTTGPRPSREPQVVAASDGGVDLTGQPSSVDIALPPAARAAVRATDAAQPARVYLNVEGITAERQPGVVYEVFLNLNEGAPSPSADDPHFVGHVTFFSARHTGGGHKQTFDITGLVQELTGRGLWDESRVKVTFSPLGLLPPPGAEPRREAVAPARAPQPRARVGRVSIVQR